VDRSFRSGLILLGGIALLAAALAVQAILLETKLWTLVLAGAGAVLSAWGAFALRRELGALLRRRRGEIALYTLGAMGVLVALAYLSVRYPMRFDMTEVGRFSLADQTVTMLKRVDKPVHITFFHDPLMRETDELYKLMAAQNDLIRIDFYDPNLNPAQARMMGVRFAGTSILESEDRKLEIHGSTETDIANAIMRLTQGSKQVICFLDGHRENDPFSWTSHDHAEGAAGHTHGLGSQYVLHERHGLAKAREALENMNYVARTVSLVGGDPVPSDCSLLIVAGPKTELLPGEVDAVRAYLAAGGNGYFLLDPFVPTGLEPVIREFGVVLDDDIVVDAAKHFWTDVSSPAVTEYNRHQITLDMPLTFYPGVRSLSPTPERVPGTSVTPVVNSSKTSYGEHDRMTAEFDEGIDVDGPLPLMVVVNRRPLQPADATLIELGPKDETAPSDEPAAALDDSGFSPADVTGRSRIAVIGDSDFATNSFFHFLGNGNLFLNTVNYLTAQENLIGLEPRSKDLPRLSLTNRQMKGTFVLSVILIPAVLAVIGGAVWWRQR
jgi:ABC-type uncharacterized transport system involved in gliding motility auxiliary subunit